MKVLKYSIVTILCSILLLISSIPTSTAQSNLTIDDKQPTTISHNFEFMTDYVKYAIPIEITNGTIKEINMDCVEWSLKVDIIPNAKGKLMIDISTELIDPLWAIWIDYVDVDVAEINGTEITIPFSSDAKRIEIHGRNTFTPDSGACKIIHNPPYSHILPPLKQMKNGVTQEEVICRESFSKMHKPSLGNLETIVCVKSLSVDKLEERGWLKN